jgi:AraC family transcriptional regulator
MMQSELVTCDMSDSVIGDVTTFNVETAGRLPPPLVMPILGASSQRAFADAVMKLLESAGSTECRDEVRQCIAKAVSLTRIWQESSTNDHEMPARGGLAPWQVSQSKNYIERNLSNTIKIRDIAHMVGLSGSYFFQAFRCTVGITPHTYIVQRRVECAQRMILLTDRKLSDIALECGLSDQSHLTRLFRSVVGVSPGVWRRTHSSIRYSRLPESAPEECRMKIISSSL